MKSELKRYLTLGAAITTSAFLVSCDGNDGANGANGANGADGAPGKDAPQGGSGVKPADVSTDFASNIDNTKIGDLKLVDADGNPPALDLEGGVFSGNKILDAGGKNWTFDAPVISGNMLTLSNIQGLGAATPTAPDQAAIDAALNGNNKDQGADDLSSTTIKANAINPHDAADVETTTSATPFDEHLEAFNKNAQKLTSINGLINGRGASKGKTVAYNGTDVTVDGTKVTGTGDVELSIVQKADAYAKANTVGETKDTVLDPTAADFVGLKAITASNDVTFTNTAYYNSAKKALSNAEAYVAALEAANAETLARIKAELVNALGPNGSSTLVLANAVLVLTITDAFANDEDITQQVDATLTYDLSGAKVDENNALFGNGQLRIVPDATVTTATLNGVGELQQGN